MQVGLGNGQQSSLLQVDCLEILVKIWIHEERRRRPRKSIGQLKRPTAEARTDLDGANSNLVAADCYGQDWLLGPSDDSDDWVALDLDLVEAIG